MRWLRRWTGRASGGHPDSSLMNTAHNDNRTEILFGSSLLSWTGVKVVSSLSIIFVAICQFAFVVNRGVKREVDQFAVVPRASPSWLDKKRLRQYPSSCFELLVLVASCWERKIFWLAALIFLSSKILVLASKRNPFVYAGRWSISLEVMGL